MQKATQAYVQTKVTTTSPGEVLIMLYDGAINYLVQAKVKIKAKDFAAKGILISKALDVINELSSSINKEKGGDLAENLSNLYLLCSSKLAMANLKMDIARIDQVIQILSGLRSAYVQIMETPEAQACNAEIAANQRVDGIMPPRMPQSQYRTPPPQVQMTSFSGAKRNNAYAQQQGMRLTPFTQNDVEKAEQEVTANTIANNVPDKQIANVASVEAQKTPEAPIEAVTPAVPFAPTGFAKPATGFSRYGSAALK